MIIHEARTVPRRVILVAARSRSGAARGRVGTLEPIRSARFGRMQPVVPDRTAFGAPAQRETERGHAKDEDTPTQHHPPVPKRGIIPGQVRHFQAEGAGARPGDFAAPMGAQ
ncbi:protein of unknown function [Bradyrhizobium vignae]|uniref:Uncharacterized protein n=1 Tax=Bradyrhizobium vignae TaxID=1549949 RepID=A0A2U3PZ31_9BRAD|nr:protein of unknown function [Bradyrhizobium vignae]